MSSLPSLLTSCFSPGEFLVEVLAECEDGSRLRLAMPPPEARGSLEWFDLGVQACSRRGLLASSEFWNLLQRSRPGRCEELHRVRRSHIARAAEDDPPTREAVERAVAAIAGHWNTYSSYADILHSAGHREDLPPVRSEVSLIHWSLSALVQRPDAPSLFRLARLMRAASGDASLVVATRIIERLALCACDGEVPRALQIAWLDVATGPDGTSLAFRSWEPAISRDTGASVDSGPVDHELAPGLLVRLTAGADGRSLDVQLRVRSNSPWMGQTLRLCDGVRSLVRRLWPLRGDRLGDGTTLELVLVHTINLEESPG